MTQRKPRRKPVHEAQCGRDLLQANAGVIIQALLDYQTPAGDFSRSIDVSLSAEACLFAAAALIATSRGEDLEGCVQRGGANLASYARKLREQIITGENPIEQLAAIGFPKKSAH